MSKLYTYKQFSPKISKDVFLADGCKIIGNALLGDKVNVWYNSVIRADVNEIKIGENTNIQDLSMLHVTEKHALKIGRNVSVGHSVILHGCEIGDGCLIGMGAKILDGAVIGKNCLVAAGTVVAPNKKYPDGSFIMGIPGTLKRVLEAHEVEKISNHYKSYLSYAKDFMDSKVVRELL